MNNKYFTLDTVEGYKYYDSPRALFIHIRGIKFFNCTDNFSIKSFSVSANGIPLINISNMDFFKFNNIITKENDDIYFNFEKLNMLNYIEDTGLYKIEVYIYFYGDCKNNKIYYNNTIQLRHLSKNWHNMNEFYYLTYNGYKNNDIINIDTQNSLMNGIVVSGIDYDIINSINVKYNTKCEEKYRFSEIYYKNKWINMLEYNFYKLDDNTIYIPFTKYKNLSDSPDWNCDTVNGKSIWNIELQFDLDDDDKLLNTYDLKFGMYVYNELIKITKKWVRTMSINTISNVLKEE